MYGNEIDLYAEMYGNEIDLYMVGYGMGGERMNVVLQLLTLCVQYFCIFSLHEACQIQLVIQLGGRR